jgi:hypothetical protein
MFSHSGFLHTFFRYLFHDLTYLSIFIIWSVYVVYWYTQMYFQAHVFQIKLITLITMFEFKLNEKKTTSKIAALAALHILPA